MADLKGLSDKFDTDVTEVFSFENSVQARCSIGGPHVKMVERQIEVLRAAMGN